MWIYKITTGQLFHEETLVATGYSGHDRAKNNPRFQAYPNRGPIPSGWWVFGVAFDSDTHGPLCIPINRARDTETFDRNGFLCHGDSISEPGTASLGCMIQQKDVRVQINESTDKNLLVIE